jgi:hypothetical protein
MFEFQSLGDNTELGFIQRFCGAEPLSLFRFNTSYIHTLTHALETRLVHLYTEDDLIIIEETAADQFVLKSRNYNQDFQVLTLVSPKKMPLLAFRQRELKRMAYLKERFLEDLANGPKIFVRKGCDSIHDLRRLRRVLAEHGSHVLLAVAVADASHPAGTVEWLDDGLMRGYIEYFKVCSRPEPHDVIGWVTMLKAAYRTIHPRVVYEQPKRLASGATMNAFGAGRDIEGRPTRYWHRAQRRAFSAHASNDAVLALRDMPMRGVEPRKTILFSAWVRVPRSFVGEMIEVGFQGLPTLHSHPVDLKRRDCWQHVWATSRAPRDETRLVAEIRARCASGASIALAGWSLETGVTPLPPPLLVRSRLSTMAERSRRVVGALVGLPRMITRHGASPKPRYEPVDQTTDSFRRAAEILIARQDFVEADDLLSLALATFPNDPALAKLYAVSAHNSGRYSGAVNRWIIAEQLDPLDPMCIAGIASNLREHGALDRAADVIENALAKFPDDMIVLTEAARIAEATSRPADALCLWEKAIAFHGTHPEWLFGRDRTRSAIAT